MKLNENYKGVTTGIDTFEDYIKFTNLVLKYKISDNTLYTDFIKYFGQHEKK